VVDRLSGLWDRQGPLALYLQEQKLCSLFFTGVNTDACVYDTLTDAYHQGFDIFLIKDLCSTPHPEYTVQMVLYNVARVFPQLQLPLDQS
jgi:nicotinamidase-related amidase